jgi:hypothetical protein
MLQKLLESDWSDYDNKKKKHIDRDFFSCTEEWETQYLIKKIKEFFQGYSEVNIRKAITACCIKLKAPHPKKEFIQCVLARLNGL